MGGGIFDNMWDPYSGAYGYPRMQPRAQYSRPQAPVYDPRGSSRVAESSFPSKVEEPVRKKIVRTIPVTDGAVPVQQVSQAEATPVVPKSNREEAARVKPAVVKFVSQDAAAKKIQAVYRGHLVRKTQPLKHLREIKKVREELENFKRKFQGKEQAEKLRSDSQERLRWTEGVMALLLRLDTLQGVHPEVRLVRKAVTKELIQFQETIDSMSIASGRLNGIDDVMIEGGTDASSDVVEEGPSDDAMIEGNTDASADTTKEGVIDDAMIEENVDASSDVAKEGVNVIDGGIDGPAAEIPEGDSNVQTVEGTNYPIPNENVPEVRLDTTVHLHAANCNDDSGPIAGSTVEEEGFVLEPMSTEADAKDLMDVEKEQILTTVPAMEEVEMEPAVLANELTPTPAERDDHGASGVDNSTVTGLLIDDIAEPISTDDALAPPAKKTNVEEMWEEAHHMERRLEEPERPALDTSLNFVNGAVGTSFDAPTRLEEIAETASRFTDQVDGWMIPAGGSQSTSSSDPLSIEKLQVSQSQLSTADGLSDRELLMQLLEENWKLKDVVGKVLHWGKRQNDIIQNLAARIEQLEEHRSLEPNLLDEEDNEGRKKRSKSLDVRRVGNRGRSLQRLGKGSRKGKLSNSSARLGNHVDSEDWPSAESDEYF